MTRRTNQSDRTRQAIIEAASEIVFGSASPDEFTMQNVADAAGVSHRTLYRHFPSRSELINAVGATLDTRLEAAMPVDVLSSFDGWVSSVDEIIGFGTAHREKLRRGLALSVTTGQFRTDRDAAYWTLFRDAFPHLDDDTARQDFTMLRHILSANATILVGQRFDLDPGQLAEAVKRAVRALVSDIRRRDRAAAKAA